MPKLDVTSVLERPTYEPNFGRRILWWFGIYFGLQLPLIGTIPFFWLFPSGLSFWTTFHKPPQPSGTGSLAWYFLYLLHFCIMLALPSKRAFRIIMSVLVVLVTLNVIGCMATNPHLTADDLH